ncbi:tail assembly chaperone [Lactobacillus sp. CC-MHH1034]|nr:tail assembly chaperone [Agrilactobacillus fermenti]
MEIVINKKKYTLFFGTKFVRELDKIAGLDVNGMGMGFSLAKTMPALQQYNPSALSNVIWAATATDPNRPSRDEVDTYIDTTTDDLKKLFDDVLSEMGKSQPLKLALSRLKATNKK